MILPISTKNDFNSVMVKWRVRMTELLKEKELSNSSTFINLHITASHSVNILYIVNLADPTEVSFIFLYISILLSHRLWSAS